MLEGSILLADIIYKHDIFVYHLSSDDTELTMFLRVFSIFSLDCSEMSNLKLKNVGVNAYSSITAIQYFQLFCLLT